MILGMSTSSKRKAERIEPALGCRGGYGPLEHLMISCLTSRSVFLLTGGIRCGDSFPQALYAV